MHILFSGQLTLKMVYLNQLMLAQVMEETAPEQ